jgi:hypothetical protein
VKCVEVGGVDGGELRVNGRKNIRFYIAMRNGEGNESVHKEGRKWKRRRR